MSTRNASEISGNSSTNDDDSEQHTPVAKKLKSSPTDLIIRIGEEKYEYHCHSMVMAYHSAFVDTALASPMQESQSRIIDIPDVSPRIWDLMMQFLDSPPTLERLKMPLDDVLSVAEKFDEYEFPNGITYCGMHICQVYQAYRRTIDVRPFDSSVMSRLIKAALRCNQLQLDGAMPTIISFFKKALTLPQEIGNHCGGLVFKEDQLKELTPFIAENSLLGDAWTKEEIECPLFPKYFLATLLKQYEEKRFGPMYRRQPMERVNLQLIKSNRETCTVATLETAPTNRGGPTRTAPAYVGLPRNRASSWRDAWPTRVALQKQTDKNWVIVVPNNTQNNEGRPSWRVLWRSPLSFNCINFPPMKPWIKVDDDAPAGTLKVVPGLLRYMGRMEEDFDFAADLRL